MFPASGAPRSTRNPVRTPSSTTATRTSSGSTLARISFPILDSLLRTLRPAHEADDPHGARRRCVKSDAGFLVAHPDVQQDRRRPDHGHQRAAAVTDERQWDAGDRHDPHGHAHVHEHVERDHGDDPHRDQAAEPIAGHGGDVQPAPDEEQEQPQQQHRPDEPDFLADHREDEVGVVLGDEPQHALGALEQSLPPHQATAHRDLRLDDPVPRAQRVEAGVDEGEQPAALIFLEQVPEDRSDHQRRPAQGGEVPPPRPRRVEHADEDGAVDQRRPQVGLFEDQHHRHGHVPEEREKAPHGAVGPRAVGHVLGERENDDNLGHLRRLKLPERAEGDPALRAEAGAPGDQHGGEQEQVEHVERAGARREHPVVDHKQEKAERHADREVKPLAAHVQERQGRDVGTAVDHHQPEPHQSDHGTEEQHVEVAEEPAGPRRGREGGAGQRGAHGLGAPGVGSGIPNAASNTRFTIGAANSAPNPTFSTMATTTSCGWSAGAYPANQAWGLPCGFSAVPVFPAIASPGIWIDAAVPRLTTAARPARSTAHVSGRRRISPPAGGAIRATTRPLGATTSVARCGVTRVPPFATAASRRATWIGVASTYPCPTAVFRVSPANHICFHTRRFQSGSGTTPALSWTRSIPVAWPSAYIRAYWARCSGPTGRATVQNTTLHDWAMPSRKLMLPWASWS